MSSNKIFEFYFLLSSKMVRLEPSYKILKCLGQMEKCMSIDQWKLLFPNQNICSVSYMQKTAWSRNVLVLALSQRFISTKCLVKIGETKIKGLLEYTSKKDFEKQYQKLKKIWETRPNGDKFVSYIDTSETICLPKLDKNPD